MTAMESHPGVDDAGGAPAWIGEWPTTNSHIYLVYTMGYFGTHRCVNVIPPVLRVLVINTQSVLEFAPENSARCRSERGAVPIKRRAGPC